MPGGPTGTHLGSRMHYRMCAESTWGSLPGAPAWYQIPNLDNGLTVRSKTPRYRPNTNWGGFRQKLHIRHQYQLSGDMTVEYRPTNADFLLDWALERNADTDDLGSCSLQRYAPHLELQQVGLVVDSLTLEATGESGVFTGRMSVRGKEETEITSLSYGDFDYDGLEMEPFMFQHAVLEIPDGTTVTDVEQFSISIQNNLYIGPYNNRLVTSLIAQSRAIELTLSKLACNDDYFDAKNSDSTLSFVATFTHPEGDTLVLTLPALYCDEDEEDETPNQVAKGAPKLMAGIDGSGDDITYNVTQTTTTTEAP